MTMSTTDAIVAAVVAHPVSPPASHTYAASDSSAERAIPLQPLPPAADMSAELRNRQTNRTAVNNDDSSPERGPALTPDPSEDHEHGQGMVEQAQLVE